MVDDTKDLEALRAENALLRQALQDQQISWRRFLDDLESRLSRPLRERK